MFLNQPLVLVHRVHRTNIIVLATAKRQLIHTLVMKVFAPVFLETLATFTTATAAIALPLAAMNAVRPEQPNVRAIPAIKPAVIMMLTPVWSGVLRLIALAEKFVLAAFAKLALQIVPAPGAPRLAAMMVAEAVAAPVLKVTIAVGTEPVLKPGATPVNAKHYLVNAFGLWEKALMNPVAAES